MPKTTRLNDLQLVLLAHAASRDDSSLLPFPTSVSDTERATHECKALLRRGLIAEAPAPNAAACWREHEDQHIGLVLTDTGRSAIGVVSGADGEESAAPERAPGPPEPERAASKRSLVIDLLRREEGATLAELVEATGWLPHSTRAVLTGLRKQGHAVTRDKRGSVTCYHIGGAA